MYYAPDPLEEVTDRLTVPIPDSSGRTVVVHPALLPRLREAIGSSLGGTRSGVNAPQERSVINVAAFTLYEDLDGRATVLTDDRTGWPEERLRRWRPRYAAAHQRGEVSEASWVFTIRLLNGWAHRIEDLMDPPVVMELLAPCPSCGARYITTGDTRVSALYAGYRRGGDITARCRVCKALWTGESQLVILAGLIDAEVNPTVLAAFRAARG
jgi:hypothetical protein